jgi:predicted nucleic acid-binding Zn finger protein
VEEKSGNTQGPVEQVTISKMRASLSQLDENDRAKLGEALAGKRFVRIQREPPIFVYLGQDEDYVLLKDTFCSCNGFFIQVLGEGRKNHCSHLAALHNIGDNYIDLSDQFELDEVFTVLLEVFYNNRSRTIRRMVYGSEES